MRINRTALTDLREAHGLSKSALAVEAEISLSYLSELESGAKENVSGEVLRKLANALACHRTSLVASPEQLREAA